MNKHIGNKFGRLLIQSTEYVPIGNEGATILKAWCECDCGNIKLVNLTNILKGLTVSCGYVRKETSAITSRNRQNFKIEGCIGKKV